MAADPGKFPGEGVHKSTTVSDTVGSHYPDPAIQEHVLYIFSNPSSPPDTNSPNVHAKSQEIVKHIVFTSFSPCFSSQVCSFCPTLSETVGFALAVKGGPGGIRASDLDATSLNCLVVNPCRNRTPKIPQSNIQNQNFSARFWGFWILDFEYFDFGYWISKFWILERYVADLYVQILEFGFQILDFGFWILDFRMDST